MNPLRLLLAPFSLLYGLVIAIRNACYNLDIFSSKRFAIPTIVVGNLSTGGTGKTPHVEYLIRLLSQDFSVATLSRGYGRKTQGFLLASDRSTHEDIGDEPKQFQSKFKDVPVAVDAKRVNGMNELMAQFPELDLVVLDDAFQHRAVKPEVAILLTPYSDLYINDYLLPTGNLREWRGASDRADIIIVTKCPELLSLLERRAIKEELAPKSHQSVYFSYFAYGSLKPVRPQDPVRRLCDVKKIFLFTGIASDEPLLDHLESFDVEVKHTRFPDHHAYTQEEITSLLKEFEVFGLTGNPLILTTEKDWMRLIGTELQDLVCQVPLYYIPIEVVFHGQDGNEFNEQIIQYVKRNQSNRSLHSREAES